MPSDPGPAGSHDPLRAIYEHEQRRPRRSRLFTGAVALLVLGAMALVVYYAYQLGLRAGAQGPAPLIKAEQQPYKVKPEEPGGMDVPNQDKLIYKEVKPAGSGANAEPVERLMPPPESPLPKPEKEEPQAQQAQAAEPPAPAAQPTPQQPSAAAAAPSAPVSPSTAAAATPPKEGVPQQVAQGGGLEAPATPAKSGSSSEPAAKPAAASESAPAAAKPAATPSASAEKAPSRAAGEAADDWHVQLGAVRTAEEAQHEWARLQGKYTDLLGQLSLNIQRVDLGGDKGVFFRIRGGPLADRAQANALCDRLKVVQVGCIAVRR